MRVRILGGGVAGVAVALAFSQRTNIDDIVVYERDSQWPSPIRQGHGLILMQNGVKALEALGASSLLQGCTPLRKAIFRDSLGLIARTEDMDDVYCMTRSSLVSGLKQYLPDQVIHYGQHCNQISLSPQKRIRAIHFTNNKVLMGEQADLWIGADGARSRLCEAFNPGQERAISRVHEIVTSTHFPDLANYLGPNFIKTRFPDRGIAFGLLSPSPERVIGYLQFDSERYPNLSRSNTSEQLRQFMIQILEDAPAPIPRYLHKANLQSAHVWRPVNAALPDHLYSENAVLIGDAAHPMLPFTSQGVSAALEDAVLLADLVYREGLEGLKNFTEMRQAEMQACIHGGQRILASFLDQSESFALPYLDGAASNIERQLGLPEHSLKQLFNVLDADGDGLIQRREFSEFMSLFDAWDLNEDIEALFSELDLNGDGVIRLEELTLSLGGDSDKISPRLQRIRAALCEYRIDIFSKERRILRTLALLQDPQDINPVLTTFATAFASEGLFLPQTVLEELVIRATTEPVDQLVKQVLKNLPSPKLEPDPLFSNEQVDLNLLRERAYNFRWATQPKDVIPLTAADPDFPMPVEIQQALVEYIQGGYVPYGPGEGLPAFREVCAERLRKRYHIPCRVEQILATNSAASALYLAVKYILRPDQEALIADPVDFLLERSVLAAGGNVRRFAVSINGEHDASVRDIEALITPGKTKLLSICNPHNPLGRVWSVQELEQLADIALRHNLWILSDEVWADIVYHPHKFTSMASLSNEVAARTFTVFGFSKNFAMAGLRLGLLVSPNADIHKDIVKMCHANETAYGVSTLSQVAGMAAYQYGESWHNRFLEHLRLQRDFAVSKLKQISGVRCHIPEGTFVLFPEISSFGYDSVDLVDYLRDEYHVALVPGSPEFFGPRSAGHIRISFATSRGILSEGLKRLEAGLTALG